VPDYLFTSKARKYGPAARGNHPLTWNLCGAAKLGRNPTLRLMSLRHFSSDPQSDSKTSFLWEWNQDIGRHIHIFSSGFEQFQSWTSLLSSSVVQIILSKDSC
jgi:hypothetical protein